MLFMHVLFFYFIFLYDAEISIWQQYSKTIWWMKSKRECYLYLQRILRYPRKERYKRVKKKNEHVCGNGWVHYKIKEDVKQKNDVKKKH